MSAPDYRTEAFRAKFGAAASVLNVEAYRIMSLKLREMVNSSSEYDAFFHHLGTMHRLQLSPVPGNLQGKGHLLSDGDNSIVLVEHESGLEILYIASSVASLMGLVPLAMQAWHWFRGRRSGRHDFRAEAIEVRTINEAGQLVEEPVHRGGVLGLPPNDPSGLEMPAFTHLLAMELKSLAKELASLSERVALLETKGRKRAKPRPKATKGRARKKR